MNSLVVYNRTDQSRIRTFLTCSQAYYTLSKSVTIWLKAHWPANPTVWQTFEKWLYDVFCVENKYRAEPDSHGPKLAMRRTIKPEKWCRCRLLHSSIQRISMSHNESGQLIRRHQIHWWDTHAPDMVPQPKSSRDLFQGWSEGRRQRLCLDWSSMPWCQQRQMGNVPRSTYHSRKGGSTLQLRFQPPDYCRISDRAP